MSCSWNGNFSWFLILQSIWHDSLVYCDVMQCQRRTQTWMCGYLIQSGYWGYNWIWSTAFKPFDVNVIDRCFLQCQQTIINYTPDNWRKKKNGRKCRSRSNAIWVFDRWWWFRAKDSFNFRLFFFFVAYPQIGRYYADAYVTDHVCVVNDCKSTFNFIYIYIIEPLRISIRHKFKSIYKLIPFIFCCFSSPLKKQFEILSHQIRSLVVFRATSVAFNTRVIGCSVCFAC